MRADEGGDPPAGIRLERFLNMVADTDDIRQVGFVTRVVGLTIEAAGPRANVGELCTIHPAGSGPVIQAEVVGFRDRHILLMPLGELAGIGPGSRVVAEHRSLVVQVGKSLLGRVLGGTGRPIDNRGPLQGCSPYQVSSRPPHPLERHRISEPLAVGVKAIDSLITCGKGQRMGIFAGSGVGKSTLMGMMARYTAADVNVIALIGERGREVRDFLERDLGPDGLARSVVVVATSDEAPLVRLKGAMVATAVAEYFRDQGLDVLFMMDSVTRFALAQREIGLAIGEPPTTRGYTPSVFALLPKLLERTGPGRTGTITGMYTVLVEGDDMNEPVADAVRSTLDGHIVLSRALAERNQYPAIDVLASVSRAMLEIVPQDHQHAAARARDLLAAYRDAEDLINIGAYVDGSNPRIDAALAHIEGLMNLLKQDITAGYHFKESLQALSAAVGQDEADAGGTPA